MTGTSMDGIDISLVKTNGIDLKRINENYFYKYSNKTKIFLLNLLNENISENLNRKETLDQIITEEHFKALQQFSILSKADLIGFHGQTIYHNPSSKNSVQLGNPLKLAKLCKKNVIFDFRSKDITLGGQGAPIAPIYHKFILENLNLELPSCILNVGGVANLTYWDGSTLIGFDTGPGNALMDNYIKNISKKFYDENGILASQGNPNKAIIKKFMNNNFFKKIPPKSLDRNSFISFYNELLDYNLSHADKMATLAELTIESIMISFSFLPNKVKAILVTGGGYKNTYLMKCLEKRVDIRFYT